MAATKLFSITSTEVKAIAYIVNPDKTDNGRLVYSFGCTANPSEASRMFQNVRDNGTGKTRILSHHMIQSFAPNEITPENALEIGKLLCEKFLKNQYQYVLAVHKDTQNIHLHIIFNNVNMMNFRSFEYLEDKGKVNERAWANLRNISDEICRANNLSVIENPDKNKGKSHYEWDMNRQGLSWKAKLKFAIDQVIKISDNFEDFLKKCRESGIEVSYIPEHKIDLKFRMKGQQKWSRARTLGWYYETKQIRRRIEMCKGIISYTPKTKIIKTTSDRFQNSFYLNRWADIQNMKEASRVINILTKYGIQDNIDLENHALSDYAQMGKLSEELNNINTQIEDLTAKIKSARTYQKYKPIIDELKSLNGRKKIKFSESHADEISLYRKASQQLKEWFPNGNIPTPDSMERKRDKLIQNRQSKHENYKTMKEQISELNYARQALDDFLKNEREVQEQKRKKSDLE